MQNDNVKFKIIFLTILCFGVFGMAESSQAADWYVAQTSAGSDSGVDCANAHAATWFNTSGNWANPKVSGKIGPGDTVHLCGTISTQLTVRAGGTDGSSIIVLFESGAKLSQPAAILLNTGGYDYLTIDGGSNGVIENTDNGTPPAYSNQAYVLGITASGSENLEIKNLTIRGMYIHTSIDDNVSMPNRPTGIYFNGVGNNIRIHHNNFGDAMTAIALLTPTSGAGGVYIYNNNFTNVDHGVSVGGASTSTSADGYSNVNIYNNHFGSTVNWDATSNSWHHDGVHVYHPSGYVLTGLNIYNNLFDGDWGTHNTANIFLEGEYSAPKALDKGIRNTTIYNNVFVPTNTQMNNGMLTIAGANTRVLNNTFVGSGVTGICVYGSSGNSDHIFKNNVVTSCNQLMSAFTGTSSNSNIDNNLYANGLGNAFVWRATASDSYAFFNSFTTWQNDIIADGHSAYVADAGLNGFGYPLLSSAVIAAGTNLTSFGITSLNTDKDGVTRPSSGAWTIGAYEYVSPSDLTSPAAPQGLAVQ